MIPVSVVIPVKNEEINLRHCLNKLTDYSEVLVVDSGSTDRTREIAHEHDVTLVDFKWNGQFPKKRNWVLRNVPLQNSWVLFLDADEYVSEAFNDEVAKIVQDESVNGCWITYHNHFMGRLLKHGDPMCKLALFRVGKGEYERIEEDSWSQLDMEVHEHPIIKGRVVSLKTPIVHNDYKDFSAYLTRHNSYSSWEANRYLALRKSGFAGLTKRQRFKYRLLDSWLLAPVYFLGAYVLKLGFLDGKEGLFLAVNKMLYYFQIKCKIHEQKGTRAQ